MLIEKFPDEFLNSSTILAQVYTRVGELSKAIEIWKAGIKKGYAYGLDNRYISNTLRTIPEFDILVKEESKLAGYHAYEA